MLTGPTQAWVLGWHGRKMVYSVFLLAGWQMFNVAVVIWSITTVIPVGWLRTKTSQESGWNVRTLQVCLLTLLCICSEWMHVCGSSHCICGHIKTQTLRLRWLYGDWLHVHRHQFKHSTCESRQCAFIYPLWVYDLMWGETLIYGQSLRRDVGMLW